MEKSYRNNKLHIEGMSCISCENKIEKKLRNTAGIKKVSVSYSSGIADVIYDMHIINLKEIEAVIERQGYHVLKNNNGIQQNIRYTVGILAIIVSLYALLWQLGILNFLVPSQLADTKMGYGMLFVIGLITSIHCIAMCGGINLSQCIPKGEGEHGKGSGIQTYTPALLYNSGRVISYTLVGFVLGTVGFLFGGGSNVGLPVFAQGILKLFAGIFMVIMGINMLGIIPGLRKLQPRMPKFVANKIGAGKANSKSPLIVGLLNGLMPCGPLQSMQIVALASGNPFVGALSMFLFSLGTVPLMLGFGSVFSALGQKFTQKVMTVGAVLVVVLGLAMLSQGGSLSGLFLPDLLLPIVIGLSGIGVIYSIPFKKRSYKAVSTAAAFFAVVLMVSAVNSDIVGGNSTAGSVADVNIVDGKQVINSELSPSRFPNITVQVGTPVKWIIDAPQRSVNGCNYQINIPDFDIEGYEFNTGENVIEFTPQQTGKFQYSCWMGMIRGTITVAETGTEGTDINEEESNTEENAGGSTLPIPENSAISTDNAVANNGVQYVTSTMSYNGYEPIRVREGIPVKWTMNVPEDALNSCNNSIYIPQYDLRVDLKAGDNLIEFTPDKSGNFVFSCWMGMTYGNIIVERQDGSVDTTQDDGSGSLPSCCD